MGKSVFSKMSLIFLAVAVFTLIPSALVAGENACMECHEDVVKAFSKKVHSALDGKLATKGKNACMNCHSGYEKHIEEAGDAPIMAYKTESSKAKAKACLSCHTAGSPRFMAGPHAKGNMDCTSCHSIHKGKLSAHAGTKSCFKCHEDVFASFRLNEHHRLMEGALSCTSCHNPHDVATRERLGGFKHEACFKCHTDKEGPFVYEHGVIRVEGCVACHQPHGSVNRHMLLTQSTSDLCYSCHTSVPGWHSRFGKTTLCTMCHNTIHGSNTGHFLLN